MKKVNVSIEGLTPLLMNNPASMLEPAKTKSRLHKVDPKEEARKSAYSDSKGNLYVPSSAIKATILNGSSFKKIGKFSAKSILAGSLIITPEEIPLNIKEYEIDLRTVVIQRQRVPKARAKIPKWKISFTIMYNDKFIQNPEIIRDSLEDAGIRVGLLDYRPQNKGSFGTFKVVRFEY